jgi:molecular chaperone DnaJ
VTNHDYYQTLGITPAATREEILHAFRRLAMRWHPDRNLERPSEAEEKFKRLQQAYAVLKDEKTRASYDAARSEANTAPSAEYDRNKDARRNRDGSPPKPGADYFCETSIPLETAVLGGLASTRIRMAIGCGPCDARGMLFVACIACAGTGLVARGLFNLQAACARCGGNGHTSTRCHSCSGTGKNRIDKALRINIKPGVLDGMVLRARGMGSAGVNGGPNGNLLCKVRIRKDRVFGVSGLDLTRELKIDFVLACLGGTIPVMRFREAITVNIPAMTRSGTVVRVAGLGLHDRACRRTGDMLLTIAIDLPPRMRMPNEAQRALLREFSQGR